MILKMTILLTYNNEGVISKKWNLSEEEFKHFGIFVNLNNEIDISKPIPLIGINDDNFKYIHDIIKMSTDDIIIYLETCDIIRLYNIYTITDFLIMEKYQKLLGIIFSNRLNKMNMFELTNIIKILF